MSTNPLVPPKFRAFDSNGDPLSGGKLYSYEAGTTTPLATYTTRAGSVANANPVILDANGEANVWMTQGTTYKFSLYNSSDVLQWTVDNVPSPIEPTAAADTSSAAEPGGRLTLTSSTPVTTSDVTGATTVYYTPHKHNKVPIYDGTSWTLFEIVTDLSQTTSDNTKSPAAVANNSNYDVFVWNDNGTLRATRGPAWSSDTARGTGAGTTELERIGGRWVNAESISNGPAANRGTYVGTIRSDGSAQINDSLAKRHVWNMYNRVRRVLRVYETTDNWTYNSATLRQVRGVATNQVDIIVGLSEDAVRLDVKAHGWKSSNGGLVTAIGLDSTTTATVIGYVNFLSSGTAPDVEVTASYSGFPGLGRHYFAWLEATDGGTTNIIGDGGGVYTNGLTGDCLA